MYHAIEIQVGTVICPNSIAINTYNSSILVLKMTIHGSQCYKAQEDPKLRRSCTKKYNVCKIREYIFISMERVSRFIFQCLRNINNEIDEIHL